MACFCLGLTQFARGMVIVTILKTTLPADLAGLPCGLTALSLASLEQGAHHVAILSNRANRASDRALYSNLTTCRRRGWL